MQPAVDVAAVGLVQPEDQRAALGAGLRLRRKVGGGRGLGGPSWGSTPYRPAPCLLDRLQHDSGRGHREGAPGGSGCRARGRQYQQGEVEAVGSADNASVLERAWKWGWGRGRAGIFPRGAGKHRGSGKGREASRAAALTLVRHQRVGELVAAHVSSGVGGLRRPQAAVGRVGMGRAGTAEAPPPEDPRPHASPAPRPGPGGPSTHSERLRTLPRTDPPYLQSLSRASPKPCSDRSIQRWAHTWRADPRWVAPPPPRAPEHVTTVTTARASSHHRRPRAHQPTRLGLSSSSVKWGSQKSPHQMGLSVKLNTAFSTRPST